MDLNNLFVDASSETSGDEMELSEDLEEEISDN